MVADALKLLNDNNISYDDIEIVFKMEHNDITVYYWKDSILKRETFINNLYDNHSYNYEWVNRNLIRYKLEKNGTTITNIILYTQDYYLIEINNKIYEIYSLNTSEEYYTPIFENSNLNYIYEL